MPLVDTPLVPLDYATGQVTPPKENTTLPTPSPGFADAIGPAFRQYNVLGSAFNNLANRADQSIDPNYDVVADIKGTKYEPYYDSFVDVHNAQHAAAMKAQIDMEENDKRTLAASGSAGFFAGLVAGVADPTFLIPGVGVVGKIGTAYKLGNAARVGIESALTFGAYTALQETALQATQQTRPMSESVTNVGINTVIGGLLGAGAYKLLAPKDISQIGNAYDTMLRIQSGEIDAVTGARVGGSVGAERVRNTAPTNEDLSVSGWLANAIADKTKWLNPILRGNYRVSSVLRETTQMTGENTLYQQMMEKGLAPAAGGAAETEYKMLVNSRMLSAATEHDAIYKQMRDAGVKMSKQEFEERIGDAMRNGDKDTSGNVYVDRAAATWRSKVFDPFKDDAIALGNIKPSDVDVKTAVSYFSRLYNRDKLIAREFEFKSRVAPHYKTKLEGEYQVQWDQTNARLAKLDQMMQDLQMTPEQRAISLKDLETQGAALDAANPQQVERVSKINDLNKQITKAQEIGDNAQVSALRQEVARLKEEAPAEYRQYLDQRAALRARQRNIDFGVSGMEARQQQIQTQLAAIEEQAARSLAGLIKRGEVAAKQRSNWDPEKIAQHIEDMQGQYEQAVNNANNSLNRVQDQIAKARQKATELRAKAEQQAKDFKAKAKEAKGGPDALKGPALEQKAYEARAKAMTAEADAEEQIARQLEASQEAQRNHAERIQRLADRIDTAKELDPEAALAEIDNATQELIRERASANLGRGERAQRLLDRMKKYDPDAVKKRVETLEKMKREIEGKFYERWERQRLGQGIIDLGQRTKPDFSEAAKEIIDDVFEKISGRGRVGDTSSLPEYMVPITKGPMKERTFDVPDELIKDFLDSNVRNVAGRYSRQMAGEVSLTRRFGRADMRDQIQAIRDDYAAIREKVAAAKTTDEALAIVGRDKSILDNFNAWRSQDNIAATKENLLTWLNEDMRDGLRDLEALRDMIRGTYKLADNNSGMAKVVRGMNAFNYIRLSGGFLLSSLGDFYHAAFSHGLMPFLGGGVRPLLTNLSAIKLSVQEAKLAGLVAESVLHHRMLSLAEIGDPFARGTALERLLDSGTSIASKWNGMSMWQDMNEALSSVLTQNRILKGVSKGNEEKFLSYVQLGPNERSAIAEQFKLHGEVQDGVHIANTQNWTDQNAVMAYRNAVNKYVQTAVIKPGFGDLPLFARTPLGKAMLQFRSFMLAAHQRTTLRTMQEGPSAFLGGMVGTTGIGMMVAWLSAMRSGDENYQKWLKKAENPGWWITEGMDRGGMLPIMFEVANNTEKASQHLLKTTFNPIKTPAAAAFGNVSDGGQSSRMAGRDIFSTIAGPSVGLATDALRAAGAGVALAQGEDPAKAQTRAALSMTPFGTMPLMKEIIQLTTGDAAWAR